MADLGMSFDPTSVDNTQRDYTNLPDGDYQLEVDASEVKDNSKGTGKILALTVNVLAPEAFVGRRLYVNINYEHANPVAQDIGQKELSALCRAVGHTGALTNADSLHLISFMARVGTGKAQVGDGTPAAPQYPGRNEIKRYYFPDEGNLPEPKAEAPKEEKPASAAAAQPGGEPKKDRPWG